MTERREEPRLRASIPFHVVYDRRRSLRKVVDVSENGLFFATRAPPNVGSLVKLEFNACGRKVVSLGFVVRRGHCRGVPGVAVQFFAQSDQMKEVWGKFIRELTRLHASRNRRVVPTWLVTTGDERQRYTSVDPYMLKAS